VKTDWCVLTYSTDDGTQTEQVWNSRAGQVPQTITLRTGYQAWHSGPDTFHGAGFTPPAGMRIIVDWMPGMGDGSGVELGWPGQPYLFDPEA
jgi:hypothetical protein